MGTKTSIQGAPTTPAPSAGESAEQLYQAQLQYDPLVAAQQLGLAQQYGPQLQQIQQQLYPGQTALIDTMTQQAQQRLESPFGYTPQEEEALQGIRGRQIGGLQEQIRTRANLGGGLYGGRAQAREEQGINELMQSFAEQDINRRLLGGQQALQGAIPIAQMLYPQIQQIQSPLQQGVTPSADTLYSAMAQAAQPQYFPQQRQGFLSSYVT